MRVFRKRKFGNFRGKAGDVKETLPDIVYQMGAEVAAQYVAVTPMPEDYDAAINQMKQGVRYGLPHYAVPLKEDDIDEKYRYKLNRGRRASPLNFVSPRLSRPRSISRERYHSDLEEDHFVRADSPTYSHQSPIGSPVQSHRRSASPGLIRPRASSPYHLQNQRSSSPHHSAPQERIPSSSQFAHASRRSSPYHFEHQSSSTSDVARRLQRAQLSQDLQRTERQRREEEIMMMTNLVQYDPLYQQAQQLFHSMIPNPNLQIYPMVFGPQMCSYY